MAERKGGAVQVAAWVRPSLKSRIKAAAALEGRTVSNWLEQAALDRLKVDAPHRRMRP